MDTIHVVVLSSQPIQVTEWSSCSLFQDIGTLRKSNKSNTVHACNAAVGVLKLNRTLFYPSAPDKVDGDMSCPGVIKSASAVRKCQAKNRQS